MFAKTDVYIMLKSIMTPTLLDDVPEGCIRSYQSFYKQPVDEAIVNNTRWLSIRYPNETMARDAGMSLEEFTLYFYKVCTMNYENMSSAMDHLVRLMKKTDKVFIKAPETSISFSIKNMPVHKCDRRINLPDGEVYTAPIKTSVNGTIKYNTSTSYNGVEHHDVKLTFRNGKIVDASSNNT